MPYSILYEPHGAIKTFLGKVEVWELMDSIRKVKEQPDFSEFSYLIYDFSKAALEMLGEGDIFMTSMLVMEARYTNSKMHCAYVTEDEQLGERISHYYAENRIPFPYGVFPSLEAARQWVTRK